MGFKVLARLVPGEFARHLRESFDGNNFELLLLEDEESAEWPELFKDNTPVAVIHFHPLLDESGDENYERARFESLVGLCESSSTPLLYFSSYRVFGQCDDDIELDELAEYKDDKGNVFQRNEALCAGLEKHQIFRLSWVLGGEFEDVLLSFLKPLLDGGVMFVSDHNFGRPLHLKLLAETTLAVVQQVQCGAENWGVFHLHASDKCSEAEFCDAMVRLLNSDFDMSVAMPAVAASGDERRLLSGSANLTGDRLTRNFGVQSSSWRKGLKVAVAKALEKLDLNSKLDG